MADWRMSSHRQRWMFTPEQLTAKRELCNRAAREALVRHGTTRAEPQSNPSLTPHANPSNRPELAASTPLSHATAAAEAANGTAAASAADHPADPHPLPETLTLEEEKVLRRFYEFKVQQVCAAFRFPPTIQSTSIQYLKRFFLRYSVMQHDPKGVMLTCIYLACKIDEVYVSAEEFARGIKQDPQTVLNFELTALQALDFDLICYGPFRAIRGLVQEWRTWREGGGGGGGGGGGERQNGKVEGEDEWEQLEHGAFSAVNSLLLTDAPLLFPPGQIALAALHIASKTRGGSDFDRFLQQLSSKALESHPLPPPSVSTDSTQDLGSAPAAVDTLKAAVEQIQHLVATEGTPPSDEAVKKIDRKLKFCRNPQLLAEELMRKERKEKSRHKKRASADVARVSSLSTGEFSSTTSAGGDSLQPFPSHVDPQGIHGTKRRRSAHVARS